MFWSCPSLYNFWSEIFKTISNIIKIPFNPTALTACFGVPPTTLPLPRYKADLVALTLLARRLILLPWKSSTLPSHSMWIKDILYFIKMEKIRCIAKGSTARFYKTWGPFFDHVSDLHLIETI